MKTFDAYLCHLTRADGELVAKLRQELPMHSRRFFDPGAIAGSTKIQLVCRRYLLGAVHNSGKYFSWVVQKWGAVQQTDEFSERPEKSWISGHPTVQSLVSVQYY